ncbi:hypothetical protein V8C86DRAFT_3092170 [Haematococcus lacustris]
MQAQLGLSGNFHLLPILEHALSSIAETACELRPQRPSDDPPGQLQSRIPSATRTSSTAPTLKSNSHSHGASEAQAASFTMDSLVVPRPSSEALMVQEARWGPDLDLDLDTPGLPIGLDPARSLDLKADTAALHLPHQPSRAQPSPDRCSRIGSYREVLWGVTSADEAEVGTAPDTSVQPDTNSSSYRCLERQEAASGETQQEPLGSSKMVVSLRGPGSVFGVTNQQGNIGSGGLQDATNQASVIARGPVQVLLIPVDKLAHYRNEPLVRAALNKSAVALVVQETLERFVEHEAEVKQIETMRQVAAQQLGLEARAEEVLLPAAMRIRKLSSLQPGGQSLQHTPSLPGIASSSRC